MSIDAILARFLSGTTMLGDVEELQRLQAEAHTQATTCPTCGKVKESAAIECDVCHLHRQLIARDKFNKSK